MCVSAGNTGALMAIARFVLKTLDGIDRPAIAAVLPNQKGGVTTVLDLGANVDCSPEHLVQFAVLGTALVAAVDEIDRPTVGLLNIGEELIKGNEVVKQAADLLRASPLNFAGNVEGNDIFRGTTDVIVCDGFVGNVALKTSEGLALMLAGFVSEEFTRGPLSRLQAHGRLPVLRRFKQRVDHRRHNGASLLGLRGLVIKSHGSADAVRVRERANRGFERHVTICSTERLRRCSRFVAQLAQSPSGKPWYSSRLLPAMSPGYSRIIGTGSALPARAVSNDELARDLAQRGIETSDEWIVARTGIRQRYLAEPATTTATRSARSARRAAGSRTHGSAISI